MNKSLAPAIAGLIPTYNSSLPPELLELASSILAQSYSKASSLKQEEEIGRTYVCAHIACERLKQPLNLPKIVPRPPCPPKVYKKLYAYLDSAVPAKAPKSPSKRDLANDASSNPSTPKRVRQIKPLETPTRQRPSKARANDPRNEDGTSPTIMRAVRDLCKEFEAPGAIPHIYAGFCSIIKLQQSKGAEGGTVRGRGSRPSRQKSSTQIEEENYPALLTVILLYVYSRLSGKESTADAFVHQRDKALKILQESEIWKGASRENVVEEVQLLMREAQNGWLEIEWYTNIEEGAGLSGKSRFANIPNEAGETGAESRTLEEDEVGMEGQRSYMQPEYFSEERKQNYEKWKARVMSRVLQIEAAQEKELMNQMVMD